ncbi:hypothetical protein [Komagataeibacter xylinus]|nr:hypothetical protein [Komagataeibacter xylinus]
MLTLLNRTPGHECGMFNLRIAIHAPQAVPGPFKACHDTSRGRDI